MIVTCHAQRKADGNSFRKAILGATNRYIHQHWKRLKKVGGRVETERFEQLPTAPSQKSLDVGYYNPVVESLCKIISRGCPPGVKTEDDVELHDLRGLLLTFIAADVG